MPLTYGSTDGVKAVLPNITPLDASSTPSIATVSGWLTQTEAQVNIALGAGSVTTPATGDSATAITMLVNREAAYQVMSVRSNGQVSEEVNQWHDDFMKALDQMRAGAWTGGTTGSEFTPSMSPNPPRDPSFTRDQARNW